MKTLKDFINEVLKGNAMQAGLDPSFKYAKNEPAPKMSLSSKDMSGALAAGETAKQEFDGIIEELTEGIKDFYTTGRVKDAVSLARKLHDNNIHMADVDDLVGYMIIVDTIKDVEIIGQRMHDDDRFFRVYDYLDDPECGTYYAVHGNFVTSNGVVGEIQVITKYLRAAKSLIGHILYEVRREMYPKGSNRAVKPVLDKIDTVLENFYIAVKEADKKHSIVPYPNFDVTPEEMEIIKQNVTEKTFGRFLTVLDGTCIDNNTKIQPDEKAFFAKKQ